MLDSEERRQINPSQSTELIYTGDCDLLVYALQKSKVVVVKEDDLKVKLGTNSYMSWNMYNLNFECSNKPKGKYIAGDVCRGYALIKNITDEFK